MFKLLMIKIRMFFLKLIKDLAKAKYGPFGDICIVWAEDKENIQFKTSSVTSTLPVGAEYIVRRMIGQNALMKYGVYNTKPPHYVLYPMPSMIKALGIKKTWRFIRNWKGCSEANGRIVVNYSVWR